MDSPLLILVCEHAKCSCCHRRWFPSPPDVRLEMLHQFLGVYTRRVYCTATSASYLWIAKRKINEWARIDFRFSFFGKRTKKKRLEVEVIGNSWISLKASVGFERWFIKLQKKPARRSAFTMNGEKRMKQREQSSIEIDAGGSGDMHVLLQNLLRCFLHHVELIVNFLCLWTCKVRLMMKIVLLWELLKRDWIFFF